MKILVADDDRELRDILAFALRRAGYLVVEAMDGERALEAFRREGPNLVVLDVNMPKMDGFEVCRRIRAESAVPILMLTVRGQEEDVVKGLDSGADDYMAKPFSPQTLLARIRALFRRAGAETREEHTVGDLHLDIENQMLSIAGRPPARLTKLELRLVQFLVAHADRVVRTERLYGHVWGTRGGGDRELLKQLVYRLRQKIEEFPASPRRLVSEAGVGYRLVTGSGEAAETS
ncbi:MAG: response regulator transcription factor [Gemmatimonadetes bacterium]|nr:response regulator transcription factor [Gemmatimonadota bacterium]